MEESKINHITLKVSDSFIDTKAGIKIPSIEKEKILSSLGFKFQKDGEIYTIQIPSWRASKDISIPEDIAEEIARVYGYEKTPLTPLDANFSISQKNTEISLRNVTLSYFSNQ